MNDATALAALANLGTSLDTQLTPTTVRLHEFACRAAPVVRRRHLQRIIAVSTLLTLGTAGTAAAVLPRIVHFGGVELRRDALTPQTVVPATIPSDATIWPGEPVTLAEAKRRYRSPIRLPKLLGAPRAAYWLTPPSTGQITAVWSPSKVRGSRPTLPVTADPSVGLLLSQFRGTATGEGPIVAKTGNRNTSFRQVMVSGKPGWWISGPGHTVAIIDDTGVHAENARLADNTLLWTDGPFTYRLEANITLADALRIAVSIR